MQIEKVYSKYLFPLMAQISLVCIITFLLKKNGFICGYDSSMGMVLIAAAGTSSAVWGCVYQVRYCGKKLSDIFLDFFSVKAPLKAYGLAAVFLLLDFSDAIIGGTFCAEGPRFFILLFLKAILFGGIEEIGWRYTFQPVLEQKRPYAIATLITFLCWGIWHFLFFYVEGSIASVKVVPFAAGLLTNCFILSAVFRFSGSLWLCVMTHALINAFSQTAASGAAAVGGAAKVFIVVLAILLGRKEGTGVPSHEKRRA